ncbi:FlxA-like family protein [Desulfomicrobium salsuginis]
MRIDGAASIADMYLSGRTHTRAADTARTARGDTVTLSSEAKRLLEHFRTMQFEKDKDASAGSDSGQAASLAYSAGRVEEGAPAGSSAVSVAGAGAGASGGSGTGSQVEDIRKRIKDLMDKVKHIMDSDLPPEQKQTAAAPYLQQIQELQQQLQELMEAGKE